MRSTRLAPQSFTPLLTAAQERELGDCIEAGVLAGALLSGDLHRDVLPGVDDHELRELVRLGEHAWHTFFQANLRLVARFAHDASRRSGLAVDDLFQEGCVALAEAMRRFDVRAGTRFSTYALPWIRNAVLQQLALRGGAVDSPLWRVREARRLREVRAGMEHERGASVTLTELAAQVGRSRDWVWLTLESDRRHDDVDVLVDLPCERAARQALRDDWTAPDWVRELGSLEARVLGLRYGLDDGVERNPSQCARLLSISESTVRRVERRALAHARELLATPAAA